MAGIIDKFKAVDKSLAPESEAIREKMQTVNELKNATSSPAPSPAPPKPSAPVKKYDSNNHYGSRPGEKRIDVSDWVKPLGKFHTGTDYVPKTGAYVLEEGEQVVSKEKNKNNPYAGIPGLEDVLAGAKAPEKPKKELKHIVHRRSKNGGHILEHHYTAPEHHKPEEHTFDNHDDMMDHVMDHMTDKNEGEDNDYREPDMGDAKEKEEMNG